MKIFSLILLISGFNAENFSMPLYEEKTLKEIMEGDDGPALRLYIERKGKKNVNGNFISMNNREESLVHYAAREGKSNCLTTLLDLIPDKKDAVDEQGLTPLHYAAQRGHKKSIEVLIKVHADKEAIDKDGDTPLHGAAMMGHQECIETLIIDYKVNKEAINKGGATPLHVAALMGHKECIEALVNLKANKEATDKKKRTPLHLATLRGHTECIKTLIIKFNADKEVVDEAGCTPLHIAALMGYRECIKSLIELGADKEVVNEKGHTPLQVAALVGHKECIETLVELGANKEAIKFSTDRISESSTNDLSQPSFGEKFLTLFKTYYPTLQAQQKAHDSSEESRDLFMNSVTHLLLTSDILLQVPLEEIVARILKREEEIWVSDFQTVNSIMEMLIFYGFDEEYYILLESRAAQLDVLSWRKEMLRFLKESGFFVRVLSNEVFYSFNINFSFFHYPLDSKIIATLDEIGIFSLPAFIFSLPAFGDKIFNLLQASATRGEPALESLCLFFLHCVVRFDRNIDRVSRALLRGGTKLSTRGLSGRTILHHVIDLIKGKELKSTPQFEENIRSICRCLIEGGSGMVSQKDNKGRTALHIAALNRNQEMCKLLISYGAKVNEVDEEGNTPLHLAIYSHNEKFNESDGEIICEMFLSLWHADINAKDKKGNTPLHKAILAQDNRVCNLLLKNPILDKDAINDFNQTPLHIACMKKSHEICQMLLENRVSAVSKDVFGNQAIHYASMSGILMLRKFYVSDWRNR
jgi:ankyrin repeat protein